MPLDVPVESQPRDAVDSHLADIDTEALVIADCLRRGASVYQDCCRWIAGSQVFYAREHRLVWSMIQKCAKLETLSVQEPLNSVAEAAHDTPVSECIEGAPETTSVLEYLGGYSGLARLLRGGRESGDAHRHSAKRVAELSSHRQMLRALYRAVRNADVPGGDPLAAIEYLNRRKREIYRNSDSVESMASIAQGVDAKDLRPDTVGWWAIPQLDNACPLMAGMTSVIGARPGSGKTTMMVQEACSTARMGNRVLLISLEMTKAQLLRRSQQFNPDFADFADLIEVQDAKLRASEIAPCIERAAEAGTKLVILDYIQKVGPSFPKQYKHDTISQVSDDAAEVAKRTGVHVQLLSQLSRDKQKGRKVKMPTLEDLKGSGDIEQDAALVVLMTPLCDDNDGEGPEPVALVCPKNRWGKPRWRYDLQLDGANCRFYEHHINPELAGVPVVPKPKTPQERTDVIDEEDDTPW